jgi:hypothetical protein
LNILNDVLLLTLKLIIMKKRLLPVLLLILVTGMSFAQTHTLKVIVPETTMVCYASGSFNGWSTTANIMTKISDSPKVFTLDIEVAEGDVASCEYKYLSGPDWKYEQTQSANFKLSELTADGDTVDSFKAIYDPGQESDVTIDVLVPAELFVCYLTGSFNGWNSVSDPMTFVDSTANGKEFTLTFHTLDTTTLEYKFLSGPGWSYEQTQATNYKYMTDGGTVVCDQFKAIFDPSKVGDVTINITVPEGTAEVWVVGSWNSWDMGGAVQATKNLDNTYTAVISMVADFEYKIWCHNDWPYEEAKDAAGNGLDANRTASFETGPVFDITVAYWKQLFTSISVPKILPDTYRLYSINGTITVEGVTSGVTVFDLSGRVMENASLKGTFVSKSLKSGIYILRIDNQTQKVFVE